MVKKIKKVNQATNFKLAKISRNSFSGLTKTMSDPSLYNLRND